MTVVNCEAGEIPLRLFKPGERFEIPLSERNKVRGTVLEVLSGSVLVSIEDAYQERSFSTASGNKVTIAGGVKRKLQHLCLDCPAIRTGETERVEMAKTKEKKSGFVTLYETSGKRVPKYTDTKRRTVMAFTYRAILKLGPATFASLAKEISGEEKGISESSIRRSIFDLVERGQAKIVKKQMQAPKTLKRKSPAKSKPKAKAKPKPAPVDKAGESLAEGLEQAEKAPF